MRAIDVTTTGSGHGAPITHVGLTADGTRLATSSYDGTVIVWDVRERSSLRRLAQVRHHRLVNASGWHPTRPDVLATASADKTVAIWEIGADGRTTLLNAFARHTDDINSVAWMPDGERLICVSQDGKATLWEAFTGRFVDTVSAHTAHCMMVSVSRTGAVATVGEDGLVTVGRPDSGVAPTEKVYECSVEGCAWSNDGTRLALARDDGRLEIVDEALRPEMSVELSTSAARSVAWSADDSTLVVGAYDGAVHVVGRDGRIHGRVFDERAWPRSVTAAGTLAAVGSFWSTPHLIDMTRVAQILEPVDPTHGPNAMVFDGEALLVGCDSGTVLRARPDGRGGFDDVVGTRVSGSPVLSVAAVDGRGFAGTYSGHVVSLDAPDQVSANVGAPLPSLLGHDGVLIAGTYSGEHVELDPATLAERTRRTPHGGSVKALAPFDGDRFASCATDRTVTVGDRTERHVLWEHGNLVNAVATLSGEVVASVSRDHTAKVGRVTRDGDDRRVDTVRTLLGPDESVKCVGLIGTPDAPTVLAGSYDFGLYAWPVDWSDDASALQPARLVAEFDQGVSTICPVSERTVAVAGWDGRILLVGLDPAGEVRIEADTTVAALLERATRTLETV